MKKYLFITGSIITLYIVYLAQEMITTVLYFIAIILALVVIAGFGIGLWYVIERMLIIRAERIERQNQSKVTLFNTPHGVWTRDTDPDARYLALHLQQVQVYEGNQHLIPSIAEAEAWHIWNAPKTVTAKTVHALPATTETVNYPPLMNKLKYARRVLAVGNSDGGKSTFAKHFLFMHRDGEIIVIDPHAPSHILGVDVIGAGEDWGAISNSLDSLLEIMQGRYQDIKFGKNHLGEGNISDHRKMVITIDELTGIIKECKTASDAITSLLTRSRKVNMIICLLYHSFNVTELGISSGIRDCAQLVHLRGGNGKQHEAFLIPPSAGGKIPAEKHWTQCQTAGPFMDDMTSLDVRLKLPLAKTMKVHNLHSQEKSLTAIASDVNGVKKPNARQINEVKEILKSTT